MHAQIGGMEAHHFIGGQLHTVELDQHGTQAFQIHDWGDRIGEPIGRKGIATTEA